MFRSPTTTPRNRTAAQFRSLLSGEDGGLIIFGLFTIVAMMLATGLAIDVMRFESVRTRLQNTLDRAVLAAADLDQTVPAAAVVSDYFDREGLSGQLGETRVSECVAHRTVSADAEARIGTYFVKAVGIPSFLVPTTSTANETVENVEISLVLDISGSMRFDDRITPLRAAATEFVDLVLLGQRGENTTLSIVPYAGQVNPGPLLFDRTGASRDHGASSCVVIEQEDFQHSGLPVTSDRQVPHFMKWQIAPDYMDWGWCPSDATAIRPHSNDRDALAGFIAGMRLHDGTGTHLGMKYGLALLDPTSRDAVTALREAGLASEAAADRPLDWHAPSSQKFIVLMTDGKITDQYEPNWTRLRDVDDDRKANDVDDVDGIDHALLNATVELDYQKDTEGAAGTYGKRTTTRATNLANFNAMCDQAKDHGIIVYTIAFEAPDAAAAEMRACASTPANFFEVDQLEVGAAFNSIARQINQLRLTH